MDHNLSQEEREDLHALELGTRLDGGDLIRSLLIFVGLFVTLGPKVYISGEIYRNSREIAKLDQHIKILKEENKNLKQEFEILRFQQHLRMD